MIKTPLRIFFPGLPTILIALTFGSVITANAQTPFTLKTGTMTIDGTSSVHDWTEDVTIIAWVGLIKLEAKQVKEIKSVTVKIPVTSIKSTKGSVMDTKTYEAFNHEKNPDITYKLSGIKLVKGVIAAKGSLTMNGVTKTINMNINATVLADGDVQFSGSHVINLKDFQMTPPTAVMGSIKVGEVVTVKYDLITTPRK